MLRLLFGIVVAVVLGWFACTVKFGSRTLWEHARAIGRTQEAQELAGGAKEQAGKVADKVRRIVDEESRKAEKKAKDVLPSGPQEQLDAEDRAGLDRLVKEKAKAKPAR